MNDDITIHPGVLPETVPGYVEPLDDYQPFDIPEFGMSCEVMEDFEDDYVEAGTVNSFLTVMQIWRNYLMDPDAWVMDETKAKIEEMIASRTEAGQRERDRRLAVLGLPAPDEPAKGDDMGHLICPACSSKVDNGKNYHDECVAHSLPTFEPHVLEALRVTGVSAEVFRRLRSGRFNRRPDDVKAREKVIVWLRKNTNMSLPEIAHAIGGTSHTTVHAVLKRCEKRMVVV